MVAVEGEGEKEFTFEEKKRRLRVIYVPMMCRARCGMAEKTNELLVIRLRHSCRRALPR
jgi:hypothetical protein